MIITREEIIPSPLENIKVVKVSTDGNPRQYELTANEGYVLHDNMLDTVVINPDTLEPTGEVILGYYAGTRSVAVSYDFAANPREFYAAFESSVPADQIFNVPSGDHEIM